jgi:hypothetical protein
MRLLLLSLSEEKDGRGDFSGVEKAAANEEELTRGEEVVEEIGSEKEVSDLRGGRSVARSLR